MMKIGLLVMCLSLVGCVCTKEVGGIGVDSGFGVIFSKYQGKKILAIERKPDLLLIVYDFGTKSTHQFIRDSWRGEAPSVFLSNMDNTRKLTSDYISLDISNALIAFTTEGNRNYFANSLGKIDPRRYSKASPLFVTMNEVDLKNYLRDKTGLVAGINESDIQNRIAAGGIYCDGCPIREMRIPALEAIIEGLKNYETWVCPAYKASDCNTNIDNSDAGYAFRVQCDKECSKPCIQL